MEYNTISKDFTSDYYTPKNELKPEIDDTSFLDIRDKNCCFRQCEYIEKTGEIYKIGENRYYFPKCIIFKYIFLYFFLNSIITPIVFYFASELDLLIFIICPIFLTLEFIVSCIIVIEVYIILEPCSLVIIYGAIFYKKRKTYYYTEIEDVVSINNSGCYLVLKNGEEENIFDKNFLLISEKKQKKIEDSAEVKEKNLHIEDSSHEEKGKFVLFSNFLKSNIKNHL